MAYLRKMLGDISAPECTALMALIATQSQRTLEKWAVEYAAEGCLPIFEREYPEAGIMRGAVEGCRAYMAGSIKLKELKPLIAEARKLAAETRGEAAQAAARAVSTACATVQKPTNAFGFLLYAVAAKAYAQLGTDRPQTEYDAFAAQEMRAALESLERVAVKDEKSPVKIDWHC